MKVLVIGDVIIDKYIYGTSTRISPEAPVPVITYIEEKETKKVHRVSNTYKFRK